MIMTTTAFRIAAMGLLLAVFPSGLAAQERLPWQKPGYGREAPPTAQDPYSPHSRTTQPRLPDQGYSAPNERPQADPQTRSYQPPRRYAAPDRGTYDPPRQRYYGDREAYRERQTFSENEILDAGHRFFGSISSGLARSVARLFKNAGRPNGYILGEDAGGAFVAGLRYGEGVLYTKTHGAKRIYWQGPSVGYDFGGEGSRTMTLVYNMRSPRDVFGRFAGVQGSAYVVGGVGVQFLKRDDVTLAPIRSGVGLRLGANIGYLKYTRRPTWNPF